MKVHVVISVSVLTLLAFALAAYSQYSGGQSFSVGPASCVGGSTGDQECFATQGAGWHCVANDCVSCSGSPGVCRSWTVGCGTSSDPAGTSCGGGNVCDGSGNCVSCLSDADCSGRSACISGSCQLCATSPNQCQDWASPSGCGIVNKVAGTSCDTGIAADEFCDGSGKCVEEIIKCQPPTLACAGVLCKPDQCNEAGVCVAHGTLSQLDSDYVCSSGAWVNIHSSDANCNLALAAKGLTSPLLKRALVGETGDIAIKQYRTAIGDKLSSGEFRCPVGGVFNLRTRDCTSEAGCASDTSDVAICDNPNDCVYNGVCYSDLDDVVSYAGSGTAGNLNTRRDVWTSSEFRPEVSADVDGNSLTIEYCDPGEWQGDPTGTLSGTVSNITEVQEDGITVSILGTGLGDVTDASGFYSISDVPEGTYDVVAEHPDPAYETSLTSGVFVGAFDETTLDITVVHPNDNCNDDCTMADGLCHAECAGKGLCSFASEETKSVCDLAAPGIVDYGDEQILCCTGAIFTPSKAAVDVCGDNVISVKRPVLFKGKLVNMVVTVFDAGSCEE